MVLRASTVVDEREERPVYGPVTSPATCHRSARHAYRVLSGCPRDQDTSGWHLPTTTYSRPLTICYFQHPDDIRRVREGLRFRIRLLESDEYKDVVDHRISPTDDILADDDALDLWIRQTVGTARHVSGTCKMGPDSDPMAVVDQYCRVKGVQGLWVGDASVAPRIPRSGGLHPTVIMIGERVVDWIAAG